ncbi:synaptobrevin [Nitzschia inconspicua]|uniref:Synaptobrevin n=1 Tax=Nitzschia inconspicua TaxID=303405 RepID=A0A9K3K547_9STRA|nr:synaptobrevin [Nitzschia inconspicua]KAG7342308.1 synaptobrevin [Nitzschia inconspicua]KAG7363472.1 synaptobrevin [Nitzschia inconspicua]
MAILYALVSREKTVLAEHTETSATGNFPTVTRVLLEKIPVQDGKMTYVYDDYVFHYIVENGVCYLCMSDEKNKHRIPFGFLEDLKNNFIAKFGLEAAQTAIAFAMNEEFKNIISERMEFYNSDQADKGLDNIGAVKSQIDEVKDVMVQNIERVLERGEKIELLVDKTDRLNQQAFRFESSSRSLRRAMWWKKMRCYAIIGVVSLLVIYAASVSLCGFDFHHCKAKKN